MDNKGRGLVNVGLEGGQSEVVSDGMGIKAVSIKGAGI